MRVSRKHDQKINLKKEEYFQVEAVPFKLERTFGARAILYLGTVDRCLETFLVFADVLLLDVLVVWLLGVSVASVSELTSGASVGEATRSSAGGREVSWGVGEL